MASLPLDCDDALFFPMDLVDLWQDFDSVNAISSDQLQTSRPPRDIEHKSKIPAPAKKKNRDRRKQEIAELRINACLLQDQLHTLRLRQRAKSQAVKRMIQWQSQAEREREMREAAEAKNRQLHETLTRQSKITQRLVRMIAQKSGTSPLTLESLRSRSLGESESSDDNSLSCEISDDPTTNMITIEIQSTSTILHQTAMSVVAALWMRYMETEVNLSSFTINYEHVSSDPNHIQSFFSITTNGEVAFEGTQLVQKKTNEGSGQIEIYEIAQTLQRERGIDAVLNVTMFKDESWWRVEPIDAMDLTSVSVRRKLQLHSAQPNTLHRRAVAEAAAIHFKEELLWMQREVKNALETKDDHLQSLHTPPQDTSLTTGLGEEREDFFAAFQPTGALKF